MDTDRSPLLSEERPGSLHFGAARVALLDIEAGFWGLRRQMEALVGWRLTDAVLQQAGVNGGMSFARAVVGLDSAGSDQALRDCVAAYQAAGFGRLRDPVRGVPALDRGPRLERRGHGDPELLHGSPGREDANVSIQSRVFCGAG